MPSGPIVVQPVGVVTGGRSQPVDDGWGDVESVIRLDRDRFGVDALRGLEEFSHIEVLYLLDQVDPATVETAARRPRGRAEWPLVGIFAQRARNRPNRIGATVCRVARVEGLEITVRGLDAVDGSPVLDVKPFMVGFAARDEVRQPQWATELMQGYW